MTKSHVIRNMPIAAVQKLEPFREEDLGWDSVSTDVGCETSSQVSERSQSSGNDPDHKYFQNPIDLAASSQIKTTFLRQNGFSHLNDLDSEGKTALHRSAHLGDVEVTKALLADEDFVLVNKKDSSIFKWTVLHEASDAGHVEIIKLLMDHRRFEGTNTRDRNGKTCLHFAACHGYCEAIETILKHPRFASIGIKDHLGFTPQQIAKANGHEAAAKCLQTRVPQSKPPGLSISQTKEKTIRLSL